jgi:hypothetical protein
MRRFFSCALVDPHLVVAAALARNEAPFHCACPRSAEISQCSWARGRKPPQTMQGLSFCGGPRWQNPRADSRRPGALTQCPAAMWSGTPTGRRSRTSTPATTKPKRVKRRSNFFAVVLASDRGRRRRNPCLATSRSGQSRGTCRRTSTCSWSASRFRWDRDSNPAPTMIE